MQQISQPLTGLSLQCKLPISIPQAMGMMQQMQGGGGLPGGLPGLPGGAAGVLPVGGTTAAPPATTGPVTPAAAGPAAPGSTHPLPGPSRGNTVG